METKERGPILVIGATGRQGGAVVRHLLAAGFSVRGLTRNPAGGRAQALAAKGVAMVAGDMADGASLAAAMAGATGVFAIQDSWEHGVKAEIAQGKRVVDAAVASGVGHFVYGSVGEAQRMEGTPLHFQSKGTIERYLSASGVPSTFLQPAFFMEMLVPNERVAGRRVGDATWSLLRRSLGSTGTVQLIAVDDIGRAASEAFAHAERWAGRAMPLAGDELTYAQMTAIYRASGRPRPIWLPALPLPVVGWFNHEARENFEFIGNGGWRFDVATLRADLPWLKTFQEWATG